MFSSVCLHVSGLAVCMFLKFADVKNMVIDGICCRYLVLLRFQNVACRSVSVGFAEKNLGFRFGLGFRDKRVVNFFMTRVICHDLHHH